MSAAGWMSAAGGMSAAGWMIAAGQTPRRLDAARAEDLLPDLIPWLIALVGLVILAAIVILVVRRAFRDPDATNVDGFTLHGLKQLHESGELTKTEYETAKAATIARVRKAASKTDADKASGR